jgi:adenylate cyclase, class 2
MPPEIEIKIDINDYAIEEIKERILKIRAELFKQRHLQRDEYLDNRNKLKNTDQLLRLRDNITLTYKGPQKRKQKLKIREEIEVLIDDGEKLKTILSKLGYEKRKKKEKYRESYITGKTVITVDETPMGNYIEIEGTKESVPKIATKLGFSEKDFIKKTYTQLWKKFAEKHNYKGDMLFSNVKTNNNTKEENKEK